MSTENSATLSGWWFGTWILCFHILGIIIPTDELIFFRGVGQPPTRHSHRRWSLTTSPSASRTSARQIFLLVQQYATNIWFQHVSISIIYSKMGNSLLLFYEHHYYPKKILCCLTGKTVINYGMRWGSPLSDKSRGCSLMFFWLFQMTCVVTLSEKPR